MKSLAYRGFALVILSSAMLPGASFAAERAQARLAAQVAQERQVIVDGRLWSCEGDKCTAGSQGRSQPIGRECARAAKVLGPIIEYRQGARVLDASGITACNAASETARAATGADAAAYATQ